MGIVIRQTTQRRIRYLYYEQNVLVSSKQSENERTQL